MLKEVYNLISLFLEELCMEELTIKVNDFINDQLLDFNNIKTNELEEII